jgi:hypothetical protein
MFPVSLDCQLCFVCLTSVSCVPDVSSVSRLSVVLSGTQDTEVRQTKHNIQSRDSGNIRNTRQNIGQSRDTGNIRNNKTQK